MNVLLSIGCNSYSYLKPLRGAEKDARDIFDILVHQNPHYDKARSRLLLSPTLKDVTDALSEAFPAGEQIDVLTFFFSGHGGVKAGSFFLCTRESDRDRLSMTAFSIVSLFTLVNELRPNQVNIIVDACEAGGSSFDLAQLLKPEVIGSSDAPSVAFLGACSADQVAADSDKGSVLTNAVLKCLTGEQEVRSELPFLDLIDVGATASRLVEAGGGAQKPISWGLNLFGNGRLARNPHFDAGGAGRSFPVSRVSPVSEFGKRIRSKSPLLWEEYRLIKDEPNPRRLFNLLNEIYRDARDDIQSIISFVQGLSHTLATRAHDSSESLATSQCLATCAVSLLPHIDSEVVRSYVHEMLREIVELDTKTCCELLTRLRTEKYALLSNFSPAGELYYLPLRITKTLGWFGLSPILGTLLSRMPSNDKTYFDLVASVMEQYGDSFVTVSDEQAASLYVFLQACILGKRKELAEQATNLYFASFADRRGNVSRVGMDGAGALRYMLSLGPEEYRPKDWRPANPSLLLPVLLASGAKLSIGKTWDLRALDRRSSVFFVPTDHLHFGRPVIEDGINYTHRIGFGVWTVSEFKNEFDSAIAKSFGPELAKFPDEGVALCTIASLLFPDRVPYLLERRFST